MKKIMNNTVIGIGIAMTIFCIVGVIFDMLGGGNFQLENYAFTKMVVGCLLVGLGFGVPAIVYESERLPLIIKCLIHMGIGCTAYVAVAYAVGWIPTTIGIGPCVLTILGQLAVAVVIWLCFLRYHKNMVSKMNDRIKQMGVEK